VLNLVPGLVLLSALGYALYALITATWTALSGANPQFSAGILTAGGAVLVGVLSVIGGKILERKAAIAKELRDKKSPVYEELLRLMFRLLTSAQQDKPVTPEETAISLAEFTQRLMVWGSDEVVSAWAQFLQGGNDDPKQLGYSMERVILSIRRDLGHKNANIAPGDLLGLFAFNAKKGLTPDTTGAEK